MAKFVLKNVRLFTGGADLTGASNKVELATEVEDVDVTNYASGGWKEVIGGLASTEISAEGQWEAGDPGKVDDAAWAGLGGLGPWVACPDGAAVDGKAWLTRAMTGQYTLGGEVGAAAPWSATAKSSWPLIQGRIAHPPGTARTADGTGSARELGAVEAGQHLYASLHVLSLSGTNPGITVEIESDADSTMSAPVTQLLFDSAIEPGGQILRSAGAIPDTWYRVRWTLTGTNPSALFVVALGIK